MHVPAFKTILQTHSLH